MARQQRERGNPDQPDCDQPGPTETEPEAAAELQEEFLDRLTSAGALCRKVEERLKHISAPSARTLIKLHHLLVLRAQLRTEKDPKLLKLAGDLIRPVLEDVRINERAKTHRLAEKKYRDLVAAQKASFQKELSDVKSAGGLAPETLEVIERELKLL